jgi:hypothetical protein
MVHCGSHCENRDVSALPPSKADQSPQSHVAALIAIECEAPGAPPRCVLDRGTAAALADAVAHDLATAVPEVNGLDFVFVGALYDQAQLLRPGWPLHATLADALERLPRGSDAAHVIALGAHEGKLPLKPLEPETALFGSPMLVVPWLLSGPSALVAAVGLRLERELLDQGLIGAELALAIGEAFGIKTTHARHMTTLDLCALACAQYEHAELGALWQVIEAALLKPDQDQLATLADGSVLHYRQGRVECNSQDQRRMAQTRAILAAHGLELIGPSSRQQGQQH